MPMKLKDNLPVLPPEKGFEKPYSGGLSFNGLGGHNGELPTPPGAAT